jgi:hypothetical protein
MPRVSARRCAEPPRGQLAGILQGGICADLRGATISGHRGNEPAGSCCPDILRTLRPSRKQGTPFRTLVACPRSKPAAGPCSSITRAAARHWAPSRRVASCLPSGRWHAERSPPPGSAGTSASACCRSLPRDMRAARCSGDTEQSVHAPSGLLCHRALWRRRLGAFVAARLTAGPTTGAGFLAGLEGDGGKRSRLGPAAQPSFPPVLVRTR